MTNTVSSTTTDLFYSYSWQVLEEKVGSNTTQRYVWSPVYVDGLVLRDRDTDANGSLDERLWVQQDANWNVTALVNGTGSVVERYAYDPFGVQTVYDAAWTVRGGGSSYAWVYGFQGLRYDGVAGVNFTHTRAYSPSLGRPVQADWVRFAGGDVNLYRWEANGPVSHLDPGGLQTTVDAACARNPKFCAQLAADLGGGGAVAAGAAGTQISYSAQAAYRAGMIAQYAARYGKFAGRTCGRPGRANPSAVTAITATGAITTTVVGVTYLWLHHPQNPLNPQNRPNQERQCPDLNPPIPFPPDAQGRPTGEVTVLGPRTMTWNRPNGWFLARRYAQREALITSGKLPGLSENWQVGHILAGALGGRPQQDNNLFWVTTTANNTMSIHEGFMARSRQVRGACIRYSGQLHYADATQIYPSGITVAWDNHPFATPPGLVVPNPGTLIPNTL